MHPLSRNDVFDDSRQRRRHAGIVRMQRFSSCHGHPEASLSGLGLSIRPR